jgi:hypothetical protein
MFESFENILYPMTVFDYDNLMKMPFCGIFSIKWGKETHVFQAKLLPPAEKTMPLHANWDLYDLSQYQSPYSRNKTDVRKDNLDKIRSLLKKTLKNLDDKEPELAEGVSWQELEGDGMSA